MATARNAPRSTARPAASREKVDFDIDGLEIEEKPPLKVRVGGGIVHLQAPEMLDWQVVRSMNTDAPAQILDAVIDDADRDYWETQHFPIEKLRQLMDFYLGHFGVDLGESGA